MHNVRYIRKLSDLSVFYCLNVQLYHLCGKSRFVCAHIRQNRDIYPPSIFRLHFDSRHPPHIPQVDGGGCYREKFFLIFIFLISPVFSQYSVLRIILLFFQIVVLCSFDYDLGLLHIVENYGFDIISQFRISDSKFLLVF